MAQEGKIFRRLTLAYSTVDTRIWQRFVIAVYITTMFIKRLLSMAMGRRSIAFIGTGYQAG